MNEVIVPKVVDVNVPIMEGETKLPEASDNWAVKTFPGLKRPVPVKGTFISEPPQYEVGKIPDVVIVTKLNKARA